MLMQMDENEDVMGAMYDIFSREWIVGFDYTKEEPTTFLGRKFEKDLAGNVMLLKNLHYIMLLYEFAMKGNHVGTLPDFAIKEMDNWERAGGQCIYLSALLHALLLKDKLVSDSEIALCQGYYTHECREDNYFGRLMGKVHNGLHAWLEVKGSIVDISIRQEEQFFRFEGFPCILGEVPEGMSLIGFRETHNTAKGYGRRIAKESGTVYLDWVKKHSLSATDIYIERLKS